MLKPKKSLLFEAVFSRYSKNLLKRKFNSLRVSGLRNISQAAANGPLLVCLNHSSWWDGIVAFYISEKLGLDSYIMMDEAQLRRYFLFRRLGAFSVARERPRDAYKSVRFAAELMTHPTRAVWIFPQGEILPNGMRPLRFYRGIEKISAASPGHGLALVSLRYEFLTEFKPDIFARMVAAQTKIDGITLSAADLAEELEHSLNTLSRQIASGKTEEYEDIL